MLVSHRKEFIYTKTEKTGGTSVESYFEKWCMPKGEWEFSHAREEYAGSAGIIGYRGAHPGKACEWWNHMPAQRIREKLGDEIWQRYYKFCVVRNPFDKAASAYFYFRPGEPDFEHTGDLKSLMEDFERWVLTSPKLPIDRDKYLIDNEWGLDGVIRFESMEHDIENLCNRLNIAWNPEDLPSLKTSKRKREYRIQDLYTEKARAAVEEIYQPEITMFRYTFEDLRTG